MNKESIYRIIGYHGEYSDNVKKALRKLLKENHPDHHGDKEVFKLINDVKKELETNQVSFKYLKENDKVKYADIDYDYCKKMIIKLEEEKKSLLKLVDKEKESIVSLSNDYRALYRHSINEASNFLKNDSQKLKEIKYLSICILIVLIIIFLMVIVTKNIIVFIIFGIMCFIFILIIEKYFNAFNEISKRSEIKLKKYVGLVDDIQENVEKKEKVSKEILDNERKIAKIENDLRFYNNLLK